MEIPTSRPDAWIQRYVADVLFRVRERRMQLGLTQKEVAARLAWSRTTLVAIEAGTQPMTVRQLVQLACALRTDPWQLLPFALFNTTEKAAEKAKHGKNPRTRPRRRSPAARGLVE